MVPFDPTYVPAELRERRQWVPWQYEPQEPKPRKMPIDLRSGHHCRYTDPATWVSFEEAVAACRANDRYAGVGYVFSPDDPDRYADLVRGIYDHDWFMVAADFESYTAAQRRIDCRWEDQAGWRECAIRNIANVGWFSSDRTISEYARDIWKVM